SVPTTPWSWSTASAGIPPRCSAPAVLPARRRWTWPPSRPVRSSASRCCAMVPRRSTARTPSPAWSTSSPASRPRAGRWPTATASTTAARASCTRSPPGRGSAWARRATSTSRSSTTTRTRRSPAPTCRWTIRCSSCAMPTATRWCPQARCGGRRSRKAPRWTRANTRSTAAGGAGRSTAGASPSCAAFTANAGTPLGESTELFAFFNHARRQAWAPQFFRPVWRDEVVRAIHPDGFQPREEIREQSVGGTIGLRGSLAGDWQWETSVTHGQDAIRAYIHDSINPTFGLDSQTSFYLGKVRYAATTWNLDLRRGFEVGLASPLELSLGAEARQEDYRKWAGDPQSYTHGGGLILDGPNAGKPYSRAVGY